MHAPGALRQTLIKLPELLRPSAWVWVFDSTSGAHDNCKLPVAVLVNVKLLSSLSNDMAHNREYKARRKTIEFLALYGKLHKR
jgi:hypothetical protein